MTTPRLNIIHLPNDPKFPHREERETSFIKQIQEQGITDYKVWDGIYEKHDPKKGICMSHKRIIQDAKDNNLPCCLIMEDDAVFSAPGAFDYFISQIPEDYDLFMGLIYVGTVKDYRVMNGFSGGVTLYVVHERFYDFVLDLPDSCHIDREMGLNCFDKLYLVCNPEVVFQKGGFSDNTRTKQYYDTYLEGKPMFGR